MTEVNLERVRQNLADLEGVKKFRVPALPVPDRDGRHVERGRSGTERSETFNDPERLLTACEERGLEGIMSKRRCARSPLTPQLDQGEVSDTAESEPAAVQGIQA